MFSYIDDAEVRLYAKGYEAECHAPKESEAERRLRAIEARVQRLEEKRERERESSLLWLVAAPAAAAAVFFFCRRETRVPLLYPPQPQVYPSFPSAYL